MNQALAALKNNREFLQRWQDLEEGKVKMLLVEHDGLPIRHECFGDLLFMIWRTTLAADERFIVAHFPPADEAAHRAIKLCMPDIVRSGSESYYTGE